MLHRVASTAALIGALLLAGCRSDTAAGESRPVLAATEVVEPRPAADPAPGGAPGAPGALSETHGDKWQDHDDPKTVGGFAMFKEAWVYVDGVPVGVLREIELPPIPEVWIEQVELLDFNPGDPGPHERKYEVRRWALGDYLAGVGVDLRKIKAVYLHGGRGTVHIPGDWFYKLRKKILFDLTGNTMGKLRVFLPHELTPVRKTAFDRYAAISVIVDKPVLETNDDNKVIQDGVEVEGIPYYGQPLRGGIRLYVDGRLAVLIKRNSLGDEGRVAPGKDEWSVTGLLRARGIDPTRLVALDVVDAEERVRRLDTPIEAVTFTTETQAQGAVQLMTGEPTNVLMLWTKGKVPPVRQLSPRER
jgi:hypothetical protein